MTTWQRCTPCMPGSCSLQGTSWLLRSNASMSVCTSAAALSASHTACVPPSHCVPAEAAGAAAGAPPSHLRRRRGAQGQVRGCPSLPGLANLQHAAAGRTWGTLLLQRTPGGPAWNGPSDRCCQDPVRPLAASRAARPGLAPTANWRHDVTCLPLPPAASTAGRQPLRSSPPGTPPPCPWTPPPSRARPASPTPPPCRTRDPRPTTAAACTLPTAAGVRGWLTATAAWSIAPPAPAPAQTPAPAPATADVRMAAAPAAACWAGSPICC